MNTTAPASIEAPSPSDYPFIRIEHERQPVRTFGASSLAPVASSDAAFRQHHFNNPVSVQHTQTRGLTNLSDATFKELCEIFSPRYFDYCIDSKKDLTILASKNADFFNENEDEDGHASYEQIESYLLHKSKLTSDVSWRRVAALYNNSDPDQQQALIYFFENCWNRSLVDLLAIRAPAINIADDLVENFETKTELGEVFVLDPESKEWMIDRLFYNQFIVSAFDNHGERYLVCCSPTLKNAIAKATVFIRDCTRATTKDVLLEYIQIDKSNDTYADAYVVYTGGSNRVMKDENPRLDWIPRQKTGDKSLKAEIYAIEKALGVQWAKVTTLENDLGI